jgi:acetoin utilization deacetylase AcuC-like enzyme
MTTLLYHHPIAAQHETPPGHPERADRIRAVEQALAADTFAPLIRRDAPLGDEDDILQAHAPEHVGRVKSASPNEGWSRLDPDTYMSPATLEAALRCVGAAVAATDAVFAGEADNAFVAMRPPGHHAERRRAMGFCFFNAVAVAAYRARRKHGAERVAVVDFDVHHGNGTQDIFWFDKNLFYGSTHQMPFYPGTGAREETGVGNIFNAPLHGGDGSKEFRRAMEMVILPALAGFSPDLLIISAGFDAHRDDLLGGLDLAEPDFAWVTLKLLEQAEKSCGGRVVSVLEGGYDLAALANSTAVHVQALMRGIDASK